MLPDGQTLLHVVAWEGHARLVALLVREGVSMNVRIAAGTSAVGPTAEATAAPTATCATPLRCAVLV